VVLLLKINSSRLVAHNREEREPAEILKNIEWRQISTSLLNKSLKSDGVRNNFAASQFLEKELSQKMGCIIWTFFKS